MPFDEFGDPPGVERAEQHHVDARRQTRAQPAGTRDVEQRHGVERHRAGLPAVDQQALRLVVQVAMRRHHAFGKPVVPDV